MNLADLLNEMISRGVGHTLACSFSRGYKEVPPFLYSSVKPSKNGKRNYKKVFGKAYNDYGLYIFYDRNTGDIEYIGESASEPFRKRLSQHFNGSHGGLLAKKPSYSTTLNNCEILILYGKYNVAKSKNTHFDEDFLIGLFKPPLNDR